MIPMKRIRLKSNLFPEWPDDVARIQRIAAARGYEMNGIEAETAWLNRSREWSAGWLDLPISDEKVWGELLRYSLEEEDED